MWRSPRGPSMWDRAISFLLWLLIDVLPPVAFGTIIFLVYINLTS